MQKVKLGYTADVLMGLYEMVKLSQVLLLLFHINHLGTHQFWTFFLNELTLCSEDGEVYLLNLLVKLWLLL